MKVTAKCVFVAALILAVVLPKVTMSVDLPNQISFASKRMGVYYVMTAGLARTIEKQTGMKVIIETYANQYAYMPFFKRQENQLAILASIYVYQAYHGLDEFQKQGKTPLAYLATVHIQPLLLWTIPDTGIKTLNDMAGKTVATRSPGSILGASFVRTSLEKAWVLDQVKEVTRPSSIIETCKMLKERKFDVMAMPPNPLLLKVERSVGLVPIGPGESAIYTLTKNPYWTRYRVKPGKYGIKRAIDTAAFTFCIFTYQDLPENVAYALVKTTFENLDDFRGSHHYYKQWGLESAVKKVSVPMHPGAIKYYKEKGVWGAEQEATQRELLSQAP